MCQNRSTFANPISGKLLTLASFLDCMVPGGVSPMVDETVTASRLVLASEQIQATSRGILEAIESYTRSETSSQPSDHCS